MKIHFLGTGAAEGIPNPHCTCDVCEQTRIERGKNIRSRTSVIIDDELKVDDPPDTFYHTIRDRLDLTGLRDLLITHTHCDHFTPQDMENHLEGFAHGVKRPLHIYGHDLVVQGYRRALSENQHRLACHRVIPFKKIETQTATVTPLLADHDPEETCLLYFIEKNGKHILYGNDTGYFPDETWNWLQGKRLDAAILDCTGGFTGQKRSRNHMCIETVCEVTRIFQNEQMMNEGARIIATHFTHNAGMLHEDFVEALKPHGIEVAFDGMIIEI